MTIKNRKNAEQINGNDIEVADSSVDELFLIYDATNKRYIHSNTIDGGTP